MRASPPSCGRPRSCWSRSPSPRSGAAHTAGPRPRPRRCSTSGATHHHLGNRDDVYFDLLELSSAGTPAQITIQTPAGYRVTPSYRPGFYFGEADVYTNKGTYSGELDVAPRALFDKDPSVAGCAEGAHAVRLGDARSRARSASHTIPIAVDHSGERGEADRLPGGVRRTEAEDRRGLLRHAERVPEPDCERCLPLLGAGRPARRGRLARPRDGLRDPRRRAAPAGRHRHVLLGTTAPRTR